MNRSIRYDNGLRLVVQHNPAVRSVAVGLWVGAGSVKETEQNNGISHFTEHVMFKGTDRYTAFDIANEFESMGAMINAFTGKEGTCYYVKSVDEYAEKCFAMLAHIFTRSSFDADELDKERKVIAEEINMTEDSPEDICYDVLANTMYPDASLGRTILGSLENVRRFTRYDVLVYMDELYNADNIVVSVAGNLSMEEADKWVRRYLLHEIRQNRTTAPPLAAVAVQSRGSVRIKDFEQSNVGISYPSLPFHDPRIPTQNVFGILFGGGMSSRLFQRIREQMGLAYSVYSSPLAYKNNGNFNILLNITPANTEKAVRAVQKEIDEIVANGVTEEEFTKAKIQLKSALVFSEESVQNMMTAQGKLLLFADELYSVDKRIAEIEAVTLQDVNAYARETLTPDRVCTAYVGKKTSADVLRIVQKQ
ncbi:MAG: insulinase family protein [Clostridia bacterium]|nr:insulinase family protein [Clostridia bacterium]